jgi:aconitate hydratase
MTAATELRAFYETFSRRVRLARERSGRPLTYTEKILFAHLDSMRAPAEPELAAGALPERKKSYVGLHVDRVAMQDATAQMALLQFMHAGKSRTAVPATVHCDHLIQARVGAKDDLLRAYDDNEEVYEFLRTVSARYGIGFWKPGSGIIHQVVLENYAVPGTVIIGTDSHTPNAGGLGTVAIGVGGADAVDVMVGDALDFRWPGLVGVHLTGTLAGWTSPKDVILRLMGILTVKGGTGHIVEFFGPGTASLSCTGKGTVTNMGAEHGATTSVFPFDARMASYLRTTDRAEVADLCEAHAADLRCDPEVEQDPARYFDRVVEIDLDSLEPHVVGPHTPDLARPLSALARAVREEGYPDRFRYALIGSCTNSSYEDMGRAAHVAEQALERGCKLAAPLMVTPGSDKIQATIERDGQMRVLERAGATVLANACGPCIGQWKRDDVAGGERNSIVTSYNRNFRGRNDGNGETLAFIASPEVVIALAFGGRLSFNPLSDTLRGADGASFTLRAPSAPELPSAGFAGGLGRFVAPPGDPKGIEVAVDPASQRLQLLERFAPWDGRDLEDLLILCVAQGKTTTDHISPAGPWLRFRGHLDKISDNMFIGVTNKLGETPGTTVNHLTGARGEPIPAVARAYKAAGKGWVVFGDENYGEGSSREHAAMSPRHLGCRAVIVRSFARIHEANLKKQGVLPLTFSAPADYDRVRPTDRVGIRGLARLAPGRPLVLRLAHEDGSVDELSVVHTLSDAQIEWVKAGSALNAMARAQAGAEP